MTFRLIACDGGGIRGYISSTLIRDLDSETGGKLLKSADGFAGTSTGGLISIGLGAGVAIGTIQNIYATRAAEIFKKAP
jgi:patatin-like phospholipase/acyl hydrolase